MFVSPGPPRQMEILVIRDFVVSEPEIGASKAAFYVEYIMIGKVDLSSARFSSLPPVKVRASFDLVSTGKQETAHPNMQTASSSNTSGWRIQGSVPEPHLSVEAAIQLVTHLRNGATNVATKRNANKTIASLKQFEPHH